MIGKASRYFTLRAAQLWISGLAYLRGLCRSIARAVASLVDSHTGGSHPRYPITLERIADEAGCSVATVCRHLPELEAAGIVKVTRFPPRRLADGTVRQEPNDYELLLPAEHWREIATVESTFAARAHEPQPQPVAPVSHDWALSVRGSLSERDASPRVAIARWKLNTRDDHTFIDGMHFDELAPKILDAAKLAAEGVPDELRTRVMTCLHELKSRAHEVALLACNVSLASWDAVNAVRAWVRKTLANPAQRVDTAEHAMNILAKFVREQADELYSRERAEQRRRERQQQRDEEQREPREPTYSELLAEYHRRGRVESDAPEPIETFGYEDCEVVF